MLFYSIAFSILAVDQILKQIVHRIMLLGQSVTVIDDLLKLTYVRNTGAAFSLFVGFSLYLIVIGVLAAVAIVYFHYHIKKNDYYLQTALGFILGGSLGNLLDRVVRSYVIDYIDFGFWPVFNFADIMINLGVLLVIIRIVRRERENAPASL